MKVNHDEENDLSRFALISRSELDFNSLAKRREGLDYTCDDKGSSSNIFLTLNPPPSPVNKSRIKEELSENVIKDQLKEKTSVDNLKRETAVTDIK